MVLKPPMDGFKNGRPVIIWLLVVNQQQSPRIQSWKEHLKGYNEWNVFNMDETGCFWKALPEKGFTQKGKACKDGEKANYG